jgi:hypothetical protein
MTNEWAAISAVSALANIILGVFMFMLKSNISEREKRFNHFDNELSNMLDKINDHGIKLAVIDQKYDSIIKLLNITDSTIKRLSNTLEGCRMSCNKTRL